MKSTATLLDAVRRRLPRVRVDIETGLVGEQLGLFQWGMLTRNGEAYAWYWMLRLPSYVCKPRAELLFSQEPCWHQRVLTFVEPLKGPYSEWQGLHICEMPLER